MKEQPGDQLYHVISFMFSCKLNCHITGLPYNCEYYGGIKMLFSLLITEEMSQDLSDTSAIRQDLYISIRD